MLLDEMYGLCCGCFLQVLWGNRWRTTINFRKVVLCGLSCGLRSNSVELLEPIHMSLWT